MTEERQKWAVLYLLNRANEEIAALGDVPGSPLDTQRWINKHVQLCPAEFACKDWSSYQPAIRKIQLLSISQSEQLAWIERKGER